MNDIVIDIHAHYTPALMVDRYDDALGRKTGVTIERTPKGIELRFPGDAAPRMVSSSLVDLSARRQWMDAQGIDHQLVGGWLEIFGYDLPAQAGLAWSRYINAGLLEALQEEPRFTALATVPLQDGTLAAQVLNESLAAGFGGVMIGTLPKGAGGNLDDPSLDPFWQGASEAQTAVILHPMTFCADSRFDGYGMMNALGRVEDVSIAVARLLFSGHLLKFPGVKLVLSMGGGTLPYALGRLQKSHANAQGKVADPEAGFSTLYFDSLVFDPNALEYLALKAGAGRIMLGSDAPFPMGDPAPLVVVERSKLAPQEKQAILGGTARAVFRLSGDAAKGRGHST